MDLLVPLLDTDTHLTRAELETVTAPLLGKAVRLTEAVIRAAAVPRERIAGVFLVGGSSRIPLAATTLHRGTGIAPTVIDSPELVVATGATMSAPVAPPPPPPRVVPPPVAPAPPTPAGRRATAIKALHWTELAFMAILLLTAIIVSAIDPPPNPLIWTIAVGFGMVLPTIGAAAVAWNLVLIRRDPARARRAITVTQATLLAVVSFGALLLVALGIPNLPVLKFLPASLIVISGVLLGLTRLSSPQDLRPQWTGPGPLRTILRTQTAFLSLVALLGGWGWAVQLTVDPGALTSSRVVSFVVLVTAVVVLVVNARATDLPQRQTLLSAQGAWIVMAVLCALPWLYKGTHRFISSDGVSEGRFLMSEDWLPGGALDPINELILWLAVAGAIPAVLAIVQLRRMPRLSPSITLG